MSANESAESITAGARPTLRKPPVLETVFGRETSAIDKYRAVFVGRGGLGALLRFELITGIAGSMPGALGLWLRKISYPKLLARSGRGVVWGRHVTLRHPGRIFVGDRVAVDDHCLLDARGAGEEGIRIGDDTLIARDTIIQAKASWIRVGGRCVIGSQCQLSSAGGIEIGQAVMIAGQCYIGGGRYYTDDPAVPMRDQGAYAKGPVVIEDDVWIGAGVVVQDGVRIGRGSVIGAGMVVREDVPPMTIAVAHQRLVCLPRS